MRRPKSCSAAKYLLEGVKKKRLDEDFYACMGMTRREQPDAPTFP